MSDMIEINKLKEHSRNKEFFDDITGDRWEDFKQSVIRRGVVESIVVTQDLLIVSGHQRVRACKELGLLEVPCRITYYPDYDEKFNRTKDDMVLEDLICTNIMQRGVGNVNPMKMAKCIQELERIKGIRKGSAGKVSLDGNNFPPKSNQANLASEIGLDERQLRNYKQLNDLIPELQTMIENGSMKATVGYKIWSKMEKEEQEKLFNEIGREKLKSMTQKATQEYIDKLKQQEQENQKLKQALEQEKNKPKEYIEKIVEIDNTDYSLKNKLNTLQDELNKKEKELSKTEDKTHLLQKELYIYKQDSLEYEQFKNDIETLTKTKEDLGRQINGIKETTRLVSDIEGFLKEKLAPIRYSKSILDCKNEQIVIENLTQIINMVENWCYEVKNIIPNSNNFVEGMVIE
ncbi:ParB/RepB/Spo0J family partition protein [Clostridium botulinum]|uniref:ParB/RepB/Spo0J family partition protein n=1 Tax=Clostridium botulinum TaxID=1491 RepID=UPI001FAE9AE0|nr:ParB/RepB/Spo0J family partition protein [Clostridium botulinum]